MNKPTKLLVSFLLAIGALIYLFSLFYIGTHVLIDNAKKSDAIVVLGARVKVDETYSPCLYYRVDHAIELYREGEAKKVIMSGDGGPKMPNQAKGMEEIALKLGLNKEAILLEGKSKTTYENLVFTKELMQKNNLKSVIIVSDPYHLPRASLVAKKLGMNATVSPAFKSPCWYRFTYISPYFLREGLALMWYFIIGRI